MSTSVSLTSPAAGESFLEGLRRRLALTGLSVVYVLLAVPALAMLCILTTSLSVAVVGVGLVLLLIFVPINQQLTNLHRALSGWVLGKKIENPYRPPRPGGPLAILGGWANDPARWRDFVWTYVVVCIRWAIAWIALGLGLAVIWYALFPFIFALAPEVGPDYGLFRIDTQAEAFIEWVLLAVAFALWWWLEPILVKWCALIDRAMLSPSRGTLERRVAEVSESRAEQVDHSAAELRRIERDLHDGAQARLVSLGMSLGLAEELMAKDPEAAAKLLSEARTVTTSALGDLRSVVRGIHPPVLADRGLAGAIQALALDMSLPVSVSVTIVLPGRPPAPVESAVYFATSELLANIGKHASATRASIDVQHDGRALQVVVTDDGVGGASLAKGSGLAGVARRLAAFDGTMDLVSPVGGPTVVTLEVPCALSSPKTSPSSGTA